MKKHYGEENIDLRLVNLSLICISLLSLPAFAQIPINGFCKYISYNAEPGFQNFSTVTFNEDPYTDLALYNSGTNKLILLPGNVNASFNPPITTILKKEISSLQKINLKNEPNSYIFVSRKKRTIGKISFSESGALQISSEISFNSYPENIHLSDIDNDRIPEILVYGSSFNGLSILRIRNNKLLESSMLPGRIFSRAFFIDLNNDGYSDIAAIDLIDNSLKFFYNDSRGKFTEVRSFRLSGNIFSIQSYDFNLDGYQDIIYVNKNNINIVFGDSVASYYKSARIPAKRTPDKILIGDFNRDGNNDLAYLNRKDSRVSVIYARDDKSFYPEILYLSKANLADIIPFYSKFIHGILSLGTDGKLYLIHNFNALLDNTKLSLGGEPTTLNYFDAGNDRIYDFCFYDKKENTLNILIRNADGIPSKLYNYQLQQDYDQLIIDDKDQELKTYYCYHRNNRLVEIIILDLKTGKARRQQIYTLGPIADLKIQRDPASDRARIYVLSNKSGNLSLLVYTYKDFRYTTASSPVFAENVLKAHLGINQQIVVYSWENKRHSYHLNKRIINSELLPENTEIKYIYESSERPRIGGFTGDIFNNDMMNTIDFISDKHKSTIVATTSGGYFKVNSKIDDLSKISDNQMYFGEYRFSGLNRLFVYYPSSSSIKRVDFIAKKKVIFTTNVIDSVNVNSYFIKNLNFKKYHLVYTDSKENCITIREII